MEKVSWHYSCYAPLFLAGVSGRNRKEWGVARVIGLAGEGARTFNGPCFIYVVHTHLCQTSCQLALVVKLAIVCISQLNSRDVKPKSSIPLDCYFFSSPFFDVGRP